MTQLAKAMFGRLKADGSDTTAFENTRFSQDGPMLEVQLNPTSFHISRQNRPDVGPDKVSTTRVQTAEYPAVTGATLTFDLEFDSADEGTTGLPLDVATKLDIVRQFIVPPKGNPTKAPFRVLFVWGRFKFTGIVTQLTEDFDYFASDGTPLHAKLSVTIIEQNLEYEATLAARLATSRAISAGLSFGASVSGQFSAGGNLGFSASAGLNVGAGASAGGGFSVASSPLAGALQFGGSASVSASASANASANLSADGDFTANASGNANTVGSATSSGSAVAGLNASGTSSATATGSPSASGSASARADVNWD